MVDGCHMKLTVSVSTDSSREHALAKAFLCVGRSGSEALGGALLDKLSIQKTMVVIIVDNVQLSVL